MDNEELDENKKEKIQRVGCLVLVVLFVIYLFIAPRDKQNHEPQDPFERGPEEGYRGR